VLGFTAQLHTAGELRPIPCPLCRAAQPTVVRSSVRRRLLQCGTCTVYYFEPLQRSEELRAYFKDKYITTDGELERSYGVNRDDVFRRDADYIRHKKERGGTILDIGCAGGYFLDRFFHESNWQKCGVEPSTYAAATAAKKGIVVHVGDIGSAPFTPGMFDVVTILDAFYYFPKPLEDLHEIRRLLKPDGLLVIELPLATTRIWRISGRVGRWLTRPASALFESDHLFFYTPKAIALLLEVAGFRVSRATVLPGNERKPAFQNLLYKVYYRVSSMLCFLSRSKLMMGPRFLVAASPQWEDEAWKE
jgi:SAM-dependent methyltransferase